MAYNYQQVPFWDFVRNFDNHGAGVDHPAAGPHPETGDFPHPPGAFGNFQFGGFGPRGFGGPGDWNAWGRGGMGGRCSRRGRCHRGEESHEHEQENEKAQGSREGSPHPENPEGETGENSPHAHAHGHQRGGHGRRGGWGGRGGWGRWGRGGNRGPAGPGAFPGAGNFDLSALIESLSAHPLAQAFRNYAEQAAGNTSGEMADENDSENSFTPPIDVFSTPAAYILHVALPGAKKEDVGVNWDGEKGVLNLAGVVYRQGDEAFLKTLSQSERKVGVFERTVKLPPGAEEKEEVDVDAITAKLEDGVLVVTVPKLEKEWTEVKKVDIE